MPSILEKKNQVKTWLEGNIIGENYALNLKVLIELFLPDFRLTMASGKGIHAFPMKVTIKQISCL